MRAGLGSLTARRVHVGVCARELAEPPGRRGASVVPIDASSVEMPTGPGHPVDVKVAVTTVWNRMVEDSVRAGYGPVELGERLGLARACSLRENTVLWHPAVNRR
jgi:hypothetical protein